MQQPMNMEIAGTPDNRETGAAVRKTSTWMGGSAMAMLALFIVAMIGPAVLDSYMLRFVALAFMYLALAQSWNLIGGYAGLMSLAMPAFFGAGAIVSGVLVSVGVNGILAIFGGVLVALLIAALIAVPTLRLQGHYFVVATILISEALRNALLNVDFPWFSGSTALNIFNHTGLAHLDPRQYNIFFYYVLFGLAAVAMLTVFYLERSRWGYALRSVRDSERAANALGINAARQKLMIFLISAAMSAVVGGVWAFWLGIVETNDAFSWAFTFDVIVMVFLGGRGTLWGPVAGVCLVLAVNEWIGVGFPELHLVISGVLVTIVVLFQPDGLVRLGTGGWRAISPSQLKANLLRYKVK